MSPEARAFLDSVKGAEDPTPDDERRVLSAVRATVAVGLFTSTVLTASKTAKATGLFGFWGVKFGGALLGVVAAAALTSSAVSYFERARPAPQEPPAPARQAVVATARPEPASVPTTAEPDPPAAPSTSKSRSVAPEPASKPPSLRDEIALLAEVRAAIERGDGATALRRLDEHVTDDRQLLAERRAARILALCSLGRSEEASRAAVSFLRDYPGSIQRTAVEHSCAGQKTAGGR